VTKPPTCAQYATPPADELLSDASPMFTNGKMDSGSSLSDAVYGITLSLLAMTCPSRVMKN